MITYLLKKSHKWPNDVGEKREPLYPQYFKIALMNFEMNMQEDRFWRKVPSTFRKK